MPPTDSLSLPAALDALRRVDAEAVLLPVLVQLVVIVLAARLFAVLFRKLGQPGVVGEIAAGLMLGPSLLGRLFPDVFQAVFHPPIAGVDPTLADALFRWIFTILSQIGLILLLFLIGLEFDFSHLRAKGRSALAISASGVVIPFLLGLALVPLLYPHLERHPEAAEAVPQLGFALFLGTALSITAIPVLGRIMLELGIHRTRLGAITIASAAVDDATGWILLAGVAAAVRGDFQLQTVLTMIAQTAAFGVVMVWVARPILHRWADRALRRCGGELGITDLAVLLAAVLAASIVTNLIGIFAIFGAFLLGAVLSSHAEFREAVSRRLRDFVTAFFLPIFFTYTGLRTNVETLHTAHLWLLCGLVLAAAIVGKLAGCGLAARLTGFSPREAACVGVMMNTRGLMELVVINLGYELRVIPPSIYCMLVLMALITTVMTTPLLLRLMRGTELERHIRESGFVSE